MEPVGTLGSLTFFVRAVSQRVADANALDDEDPVLQQNVALDVTAEPALVGSNPARLQRASQGARQSTAGGRHHVVEGGRMVGILTRRGLVVLAHRAVGTEDDRGRLGRQMGLADGSPFPDDPDPGNVSRLLHVDTSNESWWSPASKHAPGRPAIGAGPRGPRG